MVAQRAPDLIKLGRLPAKELGRGVFSLIGAEHRKHDPRCWSARPFHCSRSGRTQSAIQNRKGD